MARRSPSTLAELAASLRGSCKSDLPKRMQPALAEPASSPPAGDNWLHEIKLDGYRMLCHKEGHNVHFLSRTCQDWTKRFGSLAKAADKLTAGAAILDGEVVVALPDGRTSFQALQGALSEPRSDRVVYYAFDLLHVDGYDLTSVRLEDRKNLLRRMISESGVSRIVYCDHIVGNGPEVFEQAARMGVEGIVSKRRDQKYPKGRTSSWKKTKCIQSDDFVIGGYTKPANAQYGIGALLVGQYDRRGHLIYAGRVGTGFSDSTRDLLKQELRQQQTEKSPFLKLPPDEGGKDVLFVSSSLVARVQYLERTGDWNVLRSAVYLGLRDDVEASEARLALPPQSKRATATSRRSVSRTRIEKLPDIRLTHPDKLLFSEEAITKLDLAKYYAEVAELMLPHICDRPLSLVRCPEGIGGPQFFQKRPPAGLAKYVKQVKVPSSEGTKTGMAIDDVAGLLSLVQIYALEIHAWTARIGQLEKPDRIVFDLDPDESVSFQRVKDAAIELRRILKGHGLESFLLASGGKGLHIVVPIVPRLRSEQVKEFALGIARQMATRSPHDFTTNMSLAARKGKIYIDYLRNRQGATSIGPYSPRARSGAPVAVPLGWTELESLRSPAVYSMRNLRNRLGALKNCPWAGMLRLGQVLDA
jgi:bifunctional non-homologous end joining protein LigD